MTKWRPTGWENPYPIILGTSPADPMYTEHLADMVGYNAFEIGADAILEALFKLAKESPTGTFVIDSKVQNCFMQDTQKEGG